MTKLPEQPLNHPVPGSIWYNNKTKHQYRVVDLIFDATNGIDAWKIRYVSLNAPMDISFCRSIDEFKEKFTQL